MSPSPGTEERLVREDPGLHQVHLHGGDSDRCGLGIVTNPALMAYVMRMGPLPASSGGTAMKYINTVRNNCGYALR